MELLPIASITVLYLLFTRLRDGLKRGYGWAPCPICTAVSLTWAALLILWFLGRYDDLVAIGILMGMSVVGAMYWMEKQFLKRELKHFGMMRLVLVVGGYVAVRSLLQEQWPLFGLSAIATSLLAVIISFLAQGVTHQQAVEESLGEETRSEVKALDDCC